MFLVKTSSDKPPKPVPEQGEQDDDEPAQAEGRRRVARARPDDVARLAPRNRELLPSISRLHLEPHQHQAGGGENEERDDEQDEAEREQRRGVEAAGSASANSLAIIAEIVVPWREERGLEFLVALPMTKVTAIVSPSARPRAEHHAADHADAGVGDDDAADDFQGRAANPEAASLRTGGTVSKTSREIAVMNGRTMMREHEARGQHADCRTAAPRTESRRTGTLPSVR